MKQLILLPLLLFFACQSEQPAPLTSTTTQAPTPDTTTNLRPDIRKGETLYLECCQSCHSLDMVNRHTGPALGGVTQRRPRKWLHDFTRNNFKMRKEKDSLTMLIVEEYNGALMEIYPHFDSMDIENIYAYVDSVYEAERPRIRLRRVYPYLVD